MSPLFLSVLISFHKQIPPQEPAPGAGYRVRVALATLSPGLGKLSKGRPGCAHARSGSRGHLHYLGFQGQESRRGFRWVRPAPRGPRAPRPRAPAVEGPRSRAVTAQVRSQARGGRVRAPGSRAARSPFQSDGRAGPGAARPFELAGVGAAESPGPRPGPRAERPPSPGRGGRDRKERGAALSRFPWEERPLSGAAPPPGRARRGSAAPAVGRARGASRGSANTRGPAGVRGCGAT